jgi:hypothetical protein
MPAVHPLKPEGGRTFAWIEVATANRVAVNGPPKAFHELLTLVRGAVERPDAILQARVRDGDGWCYGRKHALACTASGRLVPAPPDKIFTVDLTGRLVVIAWRWERCAPFDPRLPCDDRAELGDVIWRRTK